MPEIEQIAIGSSIPWRTDEVLDWAGFGYRIEGGISSAANEDLHARMHSVSPGYFATLGRGLGEGTSGFITLPASANGQGRVEPTETLANL